MRGLVRVSVALLALAVAAPAHAQGGGGKGGFDPSKLPKPEEIKAKAKEYLSKAPDATAELEGVVKITYKQIPTSPEKIAQQLGKEYKDQAKGFDIEAGLRQYAPQIQEVLNDVLKEAGTFEALCDLKAKSKTIKKGSYKWGFEFDGEKPTAIVLQIPDEKKPDVTKPLKISLTSTTCPDQPELKIEVVQDKKKKEKFVLGILFLRSKAKTPDFEAKLEKAADAKKEEPKKEEKKPDAPAKKDGGEGDGDGEKKKPEGGMEKKGDE